jgi:glycosyltransferase involved in cell wall biosynthesis
MSQLARDADVVLAHTHTFMTTVAAARAARRNGKPFVLIQNNPYIEYRFPLDLVQKGADATIARYTVRRADRLLAISDFTARYVERLAPGRPVTVMHLGTDRERFSPADGDRKVEIRRRLGIPVDAFVVLTVRRLFYRNGLDTLLEAAVELRDRPDLHVVIGGAGPERREIEERIGRDGLTNVQLTGFIPDDDLPDYYRAADVFVLPTRTAEGFGLVLMEAAASGVAAISTDSGAPREIIDDGVTGLLVPPGSPHELAAAIARLHDAPELLAAMSRAAYAKSSEFTWDRSIDILERVLREAVADHRA